MVALIIKFVTDNKLACIFIVLWLATSWKLGYTVYERNDYKQQVSDIQLVLDQTKLDLTVQKLNNKQLQSDINKQNNAVDELKNKSEILQQQTDIELKKIEDKAKSLEQQNQKLKDFKKSNDSCKDVTELLDNVGED